MCSVHYRLCNQVLALTEITGVKGARARLLYKAGLRTPEAVAATDIDRCVAGICTQQVNFTACQHSQHCMPAPTGTLQSSYSELASSTLLIFALSLAAVQLRAVCACPAVNLSAWHLCQNSACPCTFSKWSTESTRHCNRAVAPVLSHY
jgi:hypothetical protein